jgi:hypothetical protein
MDTGIIVPFPQRGQTSPLRMLLRFIPVARGINLRAVPEPESRKDFGGRVGSLWLVFSDPITHAAVRASEVGSIR